MADSNSSNVASVAIVVLVILAIGAAIWYFTQGGGAAATPDDVNVRIETEGGGK